MLAYKNNYIILLKFYSTLRSETFHIRLYINIAKISSREEQLEKYPHFLPSSLPFLLNNNFP
jgi:hypothetical protein